jgi:hypothetical protein
LYIYEPRIHHFSVCKLWALRSMLVVYRLI